jgi:hypothetical protein
MKHVVVSERTYAVLLLNQHNPTYNLAKFDPKPDPNPDPNPDPKSQPNKQMRLLLTISFVHYRTLQ